MGGASGPHQQEFTLTLLRMLGEALPPWSDRPGRRIPEASYCSRRFVCPELVVNTAERALGWECNGVHDWSG